MEFIRLDKKTTEKLGGIFNEELNCGILGFDPDEEESFGIGDEINNDAFVSFKFIGNDTVKEKNVVVAYDIDWDVDASEITEALDIMRVFDAAKKASEIFGISETHYVNMHTDERHDAIYDALRHSPGMGDDFFNLPRAILIPEEVWIEGADDNDVITDWLSDEYGFCINGYKLSADI